MADINVNITLPPFTGDAGSGGTQGQVPAPAAGDAAANKFLNANGLWVPVDLAVAQRTGAAIAFDRAAVYNTPTAPSDATVTLDLTGAVVGTEVVAYFDHASEPVWPSGITPAGQWTNGGLNIVRFLYQASGEISAAIVSDQNQGNPGVWRIIAKPLSESRLSSATPVADADLRFNCEAGSRYWVKLRILCGHASTVGYRYTLLFPTGATGIRIRGQYASLGTAPAATWTNAAIGNIDFTGTGTAHFIDLDVQFITGVNSGEFAFAWSQVTSNGSNAATTNTGSRLEWFKFA
jgi:hypothetical protein